MTNETFATTQDQYKASLPQYCRRTVQDELAILQVRHPLFHADIAYQGAQLLSFTPQIADNPTSWLWLSPTAEYQTGQSIRGGIPICWPWFGDATKNPPLVQQTINNIEQAPAHGFVRTIPWQLIEHQCSDTQVQLHWQPDIQAHASLWPHDCQLRLTMTLSANSLDLSLSTQAGLTPVAISQALHTYLPCDDIHNTTVSSQQISHYIDALDHWKIKETDKAIKFTAETDRIYFSEPAQALTFTCQSPAANFQLCSNSASAVVWNPWIDKSQRLSQFSDDDYQTMLCVETANVMQDCVELNPGERHTLTMTLTDKA